MAEAIRLNKYLADAGVCSRREADRLIEEGKVLVDGMVAAMGTKVEPGQEVICDGIRSEYIRSAAWTRIPKVCFL